MGQKTARSRELMALRARVAQWRKESGGGWGSRIPEVLWKEAVRVARITQLTRQVARQDLLREPGVTASEQQLRRQLALGARPAL